MKACKSTSKWSRILKKCSTNAKSFFNGDLTDESYQCVMEGDKKMKMPKTAFTITGEEIECQVACTRQENEFKVSLQNFPNEIFADSEDFLLVIKKLFWSCLDKKTKYGFKRPGMEKKYPKICPFFDKYLYTEINSSIMAEIENISQELFDGQIETLYKLLEEKMNETDLESFKLRILDYCIENLVLMSVSMAKPYMTVYQTDIVMSWSTFVGNLGGSLGLCMGFSMVTIAEIVYYTLIKHITTF